MKFNNEAVIQSYKLIDKKEQLNIIVNNKLKL